MKIILIVFIFATSLLSSCADKSTQDKNINSFVNAKHSFTGTVVRIADGDTITVLTTEKNICKEEKRCMAKLRLWGIDAPESNQPFGKQAKKILSDLIYKKEIKVEVTDTDKYNRLIANLDYESIWVNKYMVTKGAAWVYRHYTNNSDLILAEEQAKTNKIGLWGQDVEIIEPYIWRQQNKHEPQEKNIVEEQKLTKVFKNKTNYFNYKEPVKLIKGSLYDVVGKEKNIDPTLLYSISIVESAKTTDKGFIQPSQYSIRTYSKAYFPKTLNDSVSTLNSLIAQGYKSIDIGLMQINIKYHSHRVKNTTDLFDPLTNISTAADILIEFLSNQKNIYLGIGNYHSPDNERAKNYYSRVLAVYNNIIKVN